MSKTILRRSLAAITVGGALAIMAAPAAHAGPVEDYTTFAAPIVCQVLDEYPSVAGVTGVVQAVMSDSGFSPYDAGTVVGVAVRDYCPRHITELQQFIAVYSNAGTVRA